MTRWQWPPDCQISPAARAQIEAEADAPQRADDALDRRVQQLEAELQPGGKFIAVLTGAVGDAIGRNNAEVRRAFDQRDDRLAALDARLAALETWTKAADVKPRVRVPAGSRKIA